MWGFATASLAATSSVEHAEWLEWSDPEAALSVLSNSPLPKTPAAKDLESLEVRGMVYADNRQEANVEMVLHTLQSMTRRGIAGADPAARFVQAYSQSQRDQFDAAQSLLEHIDTGLVNSDTERYRILMLQGTVLRHLGRHDEAMRLYEEASDIATLMQDESRALRAMLGLARVYISNGNADRAAAQLDATEELANRLSDEAALEDIYRKRSELADNRGDRPAERHASLEALTHARKSGSRKVLMFALLNIADSYLKGGDFWISLQYSGQALAIARTLRSAAVEQTILFNEGMALIGMGRIEPGKKLAEAAIAQEMASDDLVDAQETLLEYAQGLETTHDWHAALDIYHRYIDVRERMLTAQRQQALLQLSARFNDERQARQIDLLKRDNSLRIADMGAQLLKQRMIVTACALIALICVALLWAFTTVKKANERLRISSEHDVLTGLRNRRYFNEQVLAKEVGGPVTGCVMLADLDNFKRINDTYGHPAGDVVLAAISKRLSAALRQTDTLVRWGGEEFLGVLAPMTEAEATETAQRLLHAVRDAPVVWRSERIQCTISIGFANFPMNAAATEISLDGAIRLVDKALYEAKSRGRDRACLIRLEDAAGEPSWTSITGVFQIPAGDRRVQFVETLGAAA
jgi:diguanylate cyclase (GGDEF)-like protein